MIQISPLLWLGNAGDCRDGTKVLNAGIAAVVQLAAEQPSLQLPRELILVRIPLCDGAGNSADILRFAVNTVGHLLESGVQTLVCCGAGMSRSPAVAACVIARLERLNPTEALKQIQSRAATDISPVLWHELLASLE